jgi:hypothetical protein
MSVLGCPDSLSPWGVSLRLRYTLATEVRCPKQFAGSLLFADCRGVHYF